MPAKQVKAEFTLLIYSHFQYKDTELKGNHGSVQHTHETGVKVIARGGGGGGTPRNFR